MTARSFCYYSLFKGATSNATDTLIDHDHKSKPANFGNDISKSLHFSIYRRIDSIDYIVTYDIDASSWNETSTQSAKERVNINLIEIN